VLAPVCEAHQQVVPVFMEASTAVRHGSPPDSVRRVYGPSLPWFSAITSVSARSFRLQPRSCIAGTGLEPVARSASFDERPTARTDRFLRRPAFARPEAE
jgi:hypothetical protein